MVHLSWPAPYSLALIAPLISLPLRILPGADAAQVVCSLPLFSPRRQPRASCSPAPTPPDRVCNLELNVSGMALGSTAGLVLQGWCCRWRHWGPDPKNDEEVRGKRSDELQENQGKAGVVGPHREGGGQYRHVVGGDSDIAHASHGAKLLEQRALGRTAARRQGDRGGDGDED